MLDPKIISLYLTMNVSVTYKEYIQYPVESTYNKSISGQFRSPG